MSRQRKIKMMIRPKPVLEGAGVHLKRVFGFYDTEITDPFLLLDDFHSANPAHYEPGFPWHPHRGIETITYILEGKVEHGDSMGNSGVIEPGGVQWMTAGSGIIHQEMPKGGPDKKLWGFQLWANLPAKVKMMEPRYRDIKTADIPAVNQDGAVIRVICGNVGGISGPVKGIVTDPEYLDVTVPGGGPFKRLIKNSRNVFAYVISGSGCFGAAEKAYKAEPEKLYAAGHMGDEAAAETLVIFSEGDEISVKAGGEGLRFLLVSGKPLKEPVAWYGPIVMNTEEELRTAFDEYEKGTFLKHGQKDNPPGTHA